MFFKIKQKSAKTENKEHIKLHLFFSKIITIVDNFVGLKNWIDTCDFRIQLYWECTNSTLPSIVLESIWMPSVSSTWI